LPPNGERAALMVGYLINVFEVAPEADEEFLADWESARASLAAQDGFGAIALYRALRSDVDFRFVDVASVDATAAFAAHPSLYEIVREEGAPDGTEGVTLINPFEVPADEDERLVVGWERAREAVAAQRGYLGTRLHRSLGAADLRFVDVTRWSSPLMFFRAQQQPEFREASAGLPCAAHPALYTVMRD
jgi:heme oxygenase (mycobilin-producing)